MQKSVQARKNRIISAMSGQFQLELPILKQTEIQIGIFERNLKTVSLHEYIY
ncbi:hypothetical protein BACPEC_01728 [[Bacteroides] pectinophilus ATCC 43243]|uniref:Uncharacterized protein n=1 Tax=[Bacteroides] pectinophilus ATCC 43243 TaxID=483218 RepID=B7ARM4_9FIRM|nr:hypothetical protein BACPEC_01728 [[Bacteroides] pectinophilus ATCC 43243]